MDYRYNKSVFDDYRYKSLFDDYQYNKSVFDDYQYKSVFDDYQYNKSLCDDYQGCWANNEVIDTIVIYICLFEYYYTL